MCTGLSVLTAILCDEHVLSAAAAYDRQVRLGRLRLGAGLPWDVCERQEQAGLAVPWAKVILGWAVYVARTFLSAKAKTSFLLRFL